MLLEGLGNHLGAIWPPEDATFTILVPPVAPIEPDRRQAPVEQARPQASRQQAPVEQAISESHR